MNYSIGMQEYSHGPFQVSGLNITISNKDNAQLIIQEAWGRFMKKDIKLIDHISYPSVHAIYHNYTKDGYDMLMGFITTVDMIQSNSEYITLNIPAQDYKYTKFDSNNFQVDLPIEWGKINNMSKEELDREFGYDLEMYSEDYKTCTLALSVNK
jgi:Integron-associated effector binding protein